MEKRRLFVSVDFPPVKGGIQNYLYGLVSNLDPKNTYVLTSKKGSVAEQEAFDRKQNFKIYRTDISNGINFVKQLFKLFPLYKEVKKIIKKHKIDEVHFGNTLPVGLLGILFGRKIDFYTYLYGLDILNAKNSIIKRYILKEILKSSSKVITISNYTKNTIISLGIEKEKIKIISPGFSVPNEYSHRFINLREKYSISMDTKIILTVARLHERKGHDKVIEAIKLVNKQNEKLLYVICGKGPYEMDLKNLVKEQGLGKQVLFTGEVTDEELAYWYKEADIFIMASRQIGTVGDVEGYGIVFLEANYYGVPVIGGDSGGIPDAIRHEQTGFLVDPLNPSEIADRINYLIANEEVCKTIGRQGKEWVINSCTWEERIKIFSSI
ncbi:glycosyltransferase family 4 protein [Niallia sp. Sow4_A1]|uniref:glycosyltransferase family 4 protein n=1 Tax=Niallia sp. Sow4_A1 TaxID=3438793 RepID=UPI003F97B2D3